MPLSSGNRFTPFMLGRYAVLAPLAAGGMARVMLAEPADSVGLARPVVIKLILDHFASDDQFVRMFVDEANIALNLSHPNVVQLLELQQDAGRFYMVLEWVDGPDLHRLLSALREDGKRMEVELAVYAVASAVRGLSHVHDARDRAGHPLGIIHRDVTPGNLLISSTGHVKLSDFGVAKARGRLTHTRTGQIKGKLAYMAPEQVQGEVDQRSDLFSAGVVLWESLAGEPLFTGPTDIATMERVLRKPVPLPSSINRKVPHELDVITLRALERNPRNRYQHAEEFAFDLGGVLGSRNPDKLASHLAKLARRYFEPISPEQIARLPRPGSGAAAGPSRWDDEVTAGPEATIVDGLALSPRDPATVPTVQITPRPVSFPGFDLPRQTDVSEETVDISDDDVIEDDPPPQMLSTVAPAPVSGLFDAILSSPAFTVAGSTMGARAVWDLLRTGGLALDAQVGMPGVAPVDGRTLARRLLVEQMLPLAEHFPMLEWENARPRSLVHDLHERMLTGALVLRNALAAGHAVVWLELGNMQFVQMGPPEPALLDGLLANLDSGAQEAALTGVLEKAIRGVPLHTSSSESGLVARGRFRLMLDARNAERLLKLVELGVWDHAVVPVVLPPFDLPPPAVALPEFLPGGTFG